MKTIITRAPQLPGVQVPKDILWLAEYVDLVNSDIESLFPRSGSTQLENAVADALSAGGKRVRSTLALLWCEAYSRRKELAVPLAVAYELAHASALVQDDIIDHSAMRRGEKSVVAKYGMATAILASDLLLFNVPKMVAKYGYLDGDRLASIFDLLGEACRASTWGEFLDMEMASLTEGREIEYEEMIRLKTSSLLSAPCASGALVGGATESQVALAGRFGEELGVAYQIQDDALDLVGDESLLGKPVFTDLRGGKKSLVLIHCLRSCSQEDREFVRSMYGRIGPFATEETSRLHGLIEKNGSLEYARRVAEGHIKKARGILEEVPRGTATSHLGELIEYLASRHH